MDDGPLWELGTTLFRLILATVMGGAVGLNRDLHHKPAGMRTHALVSLGAALAILISIEVSSTGKIKDMGAVTRVIQGVLTGIGFLGAGVIFRLDENKTIKGLTTAASIWVVSCLGMACGAGRSIPALVAIAITLVVLVFGGRVETAMHHLFFPDDPQRPP